MKLTNKQKRFIDEYMVDLNGAAACIRAGYSPKTAKEMGYENLTKPHIQEEIQIRQKALQEKTGITVDRIMAQLERVAFFDIRKLFDDKNKLIPIHKLDYDTAQCLIGLDVYIAHDDKKGVGTTTKFKIMNKLGAIIELSRILGMVFDKSKVEKKITVEIRDFADDD